MGLLGKNRKMQRGMRMTGRVLAALAFAMGLFAATPVAAQSPAEMQCRATCGAMPRDDRTRLLACLQRCGVVVQGATAQPAPRTSRNAREASPQQSRLVAGTGFGRPVAASTLPTAHAVLTPGAARATSWGAIYAAPAPHAGLGAVAGMNDRLQAHGRAESACAARANGLPCRMLVEFTSGCAAAARAERGDRVAFTAAETGTSRIAAENAAVGACQTRSRESCRVVQTVCTG